MLSKKKQIIDALMSSSIEGKSIFKKQELLDAADSVGHSKLAGKFWTDEFGQFRVGRGLYDLQKTEQVSEPKSVVVEKPLSKMEESTIAVAPSPKKQIQKLECAIQSYIPEKEPHYVKFGHYNDLKSIVKSGQFMNVFVTGLSGNGKTLMIHEICSELKRELFRVNITIETDEDDLLGGFRLVNGETVFHKGPVVDAMERGAVLLLDEIDLASNKILCLQSVLEGKGVYLKKFNQWIKPTSGFTIIATANTKGKGSETGSFVGTQILNEAFLERFAITIEQNYPTAAVEKRLLLGHMAEYDNVDDDFAEQLTKWADIIRKTYQDGGIDEIISTRRLVHIVKAHSIFNDKMSAIKLCISRFDEETKTSFLDVYTKVDENVNMDVDTDTVDEPVPF